MSNYYLYYYISSDYNIKKYFCQIAKESIEYRVKKEKEKIEKSSVLFLSNYPTKVYTNVDICLNPKDITVSFLTYIILIFLPEGTFMILPIIWLEVNPCCNSNSFTFFTSSGLTDNNNPPEVWAS